MLTFSPTEKLEWDLCFILSFLTERRCSFPGHERHFLHSGPGSLFIDERYLSDAANLCWENRSRLGVEKRPLWFYLDINDTPIIQYQALFGCIALEIIQDLEVQENDIPGNLQLLATSIKSLIHESTLDKDFKNNLKSAVGKWGKSNYISGLIALLKKYKIVTNDLEGTPLKRVREINSIRNDIVHGNKIQYPKWIEGEEERKESEYKFICTQFIPSIVKEYLIRIFGLDRFYSSIRNREVLQEYIYHGTSEGRKITDLIR